MKTIIKKIKIYKFDELSGDSKKKAIENLSDINVDYDWWNFIYEEAGNLGIEIGGFDTYRNDIEIKLIENIENISNNILEEFGKEDKLYIFSKKVREELEKIEKIENDDDFNEKMEELEEQYIEYIGDYYSKMLKEHYEYLMSDEAIIDTIEANEYDFTEDGELYSD